MKPFQIWFALEVGIAVMESTLLYHTACISFWTSKRQAICTDNSFILKKINKNENKKEKMKSHEPFQSYLLTGQADSAKKAG